MYQIAGLPVQSNQMKRVSLGFNRPYQCFPFSPWLLRLLLLLSRFSHVWLCDPIDGSPRGSPVPEILQARRLEWVAISFSNAWKWKVKSESEVAQSCPTLHDPMDCCLPGSSVHGIFQARVLEWGAIAFSVSLPYKLPNLAGPFLAYLTWSFWNLILLIIFLLGKLSPFPFRYLTLS